MNEAIAQASSLSQQPESAAGIHLDNIKHLHWVVQLQKKDTALSPRPISGDIYLYIVVKMLARRAR